MAKSKDVSKHGRASNGEVTSKSVKSGSVAKPTKSSKAQNETVVQKVVDTAKKAGNKVKQTVKAAVASDEDSETSDSSVSSESEVESKSKKEVASKSNGKKANGKSNGKAKHAKQESEDESGTSEEDSDSAGDDDDDDDAEDSDVNGKDDSSDESEESDDNEKPVKAAAATGKASSKATKVCQIV